MMNMSKNRRNQEFIQIQIDHILERAAVELQNIIDLDKLPANIDEAEEFYIFSQKLKTLPDIGGC